MVLELKFSPSLKKKKFRCTVSHTVSREQYFVLGVSRA